MINWLLCLHNGLAMLCPFTAGKGAWQFDINP
jgi:hypothetical protein